MKNQLISDVERKEFFSSRRGVDELRRTGRTTGQALICIGQALSSPGEKIEIIDHYPYERANKMLAGDIRKIVDLLGLQFLSIKREKLEPNTCWQYYLVYELFVENDVEVNRVEYASNLWTSLLQNPINLKLSRGTENASYKLGK